LINHKGYLANREVYHNSQATMDKVVQIKEMRQRKMLL